MEDRLQDRPHQPVDERVHALLAGAGVQARRVCCRTSPLWYPAWRPSLQCRRTCRRPGHCAAPSPVRRPPRCGPRGGRSTRPVRRPLRRRRAARTLGPVRTPVGPSARAAPRQRGAVRRLLLHVAPALPVPPALRGPLAGLAEHLATWPGTAVLPRVHPDGARLPRLWGSGRAFAQATWRHLLFGAVLGELERRLNPPDDVVAPIDDATHPRTDTARPSTSSLPGPRRPERAGPHHRRVRIRRRPPRGALRGRRRPRGRPSRAARGSTCSTRTPSRARWPTPRRTSSITSPRSRTWAAPGRRPRGDARSRTRRWRCTCSRPSGSTRAEAAVVAVSSGEVYGPPATLPVGEDAPLRPQNPYAVSKAVDGPARRPYADAHGLRIVRAAGLQPLGARAQPPLYAIASFTPPGRGRARGGRRPDPRRHGQPGRAARLHRRA